MCGIAGAIGSDAESLVRRMSDALVHRGPDDEGYFSTGPVALGARRLSIVDLAGGGQPMHNETGDITLICNGEIYNSPLLRKDLIAAGHRFSTRSDVEVILHLYEDYGEKCVNHLSGMFAFAIWDARRNELLLGRDHMGQKPLFFFQDNERFLFASEVQSLIASGVVGRSLDVNALWHYVSLRSIPDEYSMIRGVRKLPAATTLFRKSDGSLHMKRYWTPHFLPKQQFGLAEAEDALDECLRRTVQSHLMSDVPVGVFLSGGIDSTTIGTMMARSMADPVSAFSIGVEEAGFDELPLARKVAAAEKMDFHGERVRADIAALLPLMVHHLGEPADPYGVGLYLASHLASQHVKVVLSGDGGDEAFGGYDRYVGQRLVDLYCLLPSALRRTVMPRLIAAIPETFGYKSIAQRLAWLHTMSDSRGGERYAQSLGALRFTAEERASLFNPNVTHSIDDPDTTGKVLRYFDAHDLPSLVDRMLHTDLMMRLPDHNLVMGDRMSMACSLEVRSPFVDPGVIQFAASLPPSLKVRGRQLKYLLRKVASRYVPAEIVERPKQGFGFPLGQWMRTDLRGLVSERLRHSRLVDAGIFRHETIVRLLEDHLSGRADHSYRLWLLLGLEIWHEIYIEGRSVSDVQADIIGSNARQLA